MTNNESDNHSLSSKLISFCVICFLVVVFVICCTLGVLLHSANSSWMDERQRVIGLQERIIDLKNASSLMQRALDKCDGRLGVYEDYLIGTQVSSIKKMVRRFLADENVRSDQTTLAEFESWAYAHNGMTVHR